MFVLSSDITIGSFRFSGVNEVQITRSLHSIVETAVIRIPSIGRIIKNGQVTQQSIITGRQFKEGDEVVIKLGYDNLLQTEFRGFVRTCNLDMPVAIECEGYSWLLRRNNTVAFYKSITIKELLKKAIAGIEGHTIDLLCTVDFELTNVRINNECGFDIISKISSLTDGAISCFFVKPDTLWCGIIYTPLAQSIDPFACGAVSYRLGYNMLKENTLVVRDSSINPIEVQYTKKRANGAIISLTSNVFPAASRKYSKMLSSLNDNAAIARMANEKAYKINYTGYEGSVTSFLQPYAAPGYIAMVQDGRYPERNGKYLVEGIELSYGISGARRKVEIGARLGF